jgi:hypothetical protein
MNELIEKFIAESTIWQGHPQIDGTYFDKEKFAEMIVEECVSQCWTVSELESKGSVVSECSKQIRKHFGVEE